MGRKKKAMRKSCDLGNCDAKNRGVFFLRSIYAKCLRFGATCCGLRLRCEKVFSPAMPKTHSLDLKSQENATKKACENPAMLACDAKNRGVFKIERCEMPAIRTPAAVWPAMRAPAMPNR